MPVSEPKLVLETRSQGIVTATINRPDKSNALDAETLDLLATAIANADHDSRTRAFVIRGAGKHFCAGADVSSSSDEGSGATIVDVCTLLDKSSKPTIAVVHGACIGGGLALAACCDVLLASSDAFFSIPEVRLGFAPGPLTLFFMRAIPPRALRRYLISGERIPASQALTLGLAHAVTASGEMDAALEELLAGILQGGPGAIMDAKRILRDYRGHPLTEQALNELTADFNRRIRSPEALEGLASIREKRRPNWYL
jgi:methylglutaconyl-CoA hydratase